MGLNEFIKPDEGSEIKATSWKETEEQRERADRVFFSSDQRQAFRQLDVTTLPQQHDLLLDYKKNLVLDVLERGEVDQEILKKYKTIYPGAGVDIEYPLCLGARKIVLIDAQFNQKKIDSVLHKLTKITAREPEKISERTYTFFFDFGSGAEECRVEFDKKEFKQYDNESSYHIPNKVGCILAFFVNSGHYFHYPLYAPDLRKKLVPGGMVLTNGHALTRRELIYGRESFRKERNISLEVRNLKFDDPYFDEEANWIYDKYGFESIRVERPDFGDSQTGEGMPMTLIKKRKNEPRSV